MQPDPEGTDPKAAPAAPPPAVFIMGPTASGKTELAVQIAERLPCGIISVDSTLVYRGLDIGSAKPDPLLLARAPHRLIDIRDPREPYSAGQFREDALREMAQIVAAQRLPLLVGGTMLYFRALQYGLSALPAADPAVRARLLAQAQTLGWPALHQRLTRLDPASARRIQRTDPQRIQRALEVIELTGQPLSQQQSGATQQTLPYRVLKLARAPRDRAVLHRRINQRFARMLDQGFEQEVRGLLAAEHLSPELPALRSVGYRQMLGYLRGDYARQEMIEKGTAATRQLAKRQLTWLRADNEVHWLYDEDGEPLSRALALIERELIGEVGQGKNIRIDWG